MKQLFFILLCCSVFASAESPKDVFFKLQAELPTALCKERLKDLSEFRLLFVLPQYQTLLETGKTSKELRAALGTWSSDLLLKIALQIDEEFSPRCSGNAKIDLTLRELKRAYLLKLGLEEKDFTEKNEDVFFRTLVAVKDDLAGIMSRLAELKKAKIKGAKLLGRVYGSQTMENGVSVVAPKDFQIKKLKALLAEVCPKFPCQFWPPSALYKVVITDQPEMAAYLPELATLVVSQEILDEPNTLMKIVFLHELAHVAERNAWNRDRHDWKMEFAKFSGWTRAKNGAWEIQVEKLAKPRQDLLTELSKGSRYSMLPDAIYKARIDGKPGEGFVFAKSYTESLKRDDPSEDLADSVAVFHYMPSRFCLDGKPFAPAKYAWIRKTYFQNRQT